MLPRLDLRRRGSQPVERRRHPARHEQAHPHQQNQPAQRQHRRPPCQLPHRTQDRRRRHIQDHLPARQRHRRPVNDPLGRTPPVKSRALRRGEDFRATGFVDDVGPGIILPDHQAAVGMRDDHTRGTDQIRDVPLHSGRRRHIQLDAFEPLPHGIQRQVDPRDAMKNAVRIDDRGVDTEHRHVRAALVIIRLGETQLPRLLRSPIPDC